MNCSIISIDRGKFCISDFYFYFIFCVSCIFFLISCDNTVLEPTARYIFMCDDLQSGISKPWLLLSFTQILQCIRSPSRETVTTPRRHPAITHLYLLYRDSRRQK